MSASASGSWPAMASSVPAARRLVREHLSVHAGSPLAEDAELLVSELVANVVLHVGGTVRVAVVSTPEEVVLEVADDSPVPPAVRSFSRTSSTGRGMRLVHSLSAEHGVEVDGQGKRVWVRLTASKAERAQDELASSFADVDWLAELESADDEVPAATAEGQQDQAGTAA